jgi:hypothetical protein
MAGGIGVLPCMAAAELLWPDVAKEEEDSNVSTGGGERGGATRGVGRRAAGARGRPAVGSRARGRETGELGDSRRKTEDPVVKAENSGALL